MNSTRFVNRFSTRFVWVIGITAVCLLQSAALVYAQPRASTLPAARGAARFPGGGGRGPGLTDPMGAVAQAGFGPRAMTAPAGPSCSLDTTIYAVHVARERVGQLDLDALTKASSNAGDFEKALATMGAVAPMYRFNGSVRLSGDSIIIGGRLPYVTNTSVSSTGRTVNSVSYSDIGARLGVAGKLTGNGRIELDMNIDLSGISAGGVPISPTVNAPIFRSTTLVHKGIVQAQQPFIIVGVDASTPDSEGRAIAYIAKVTLGTPQVMQDSAAGN